ncbi:MAG: hypothetical protein BWX80_01143 [Candidatus Hydrogenedentes bacterium ADurb.Bin101]|nr:MAG: hypothetical protein BWX80_01143 [Candidatus Hydrogenedentes bacterium ADurb.Bin101]
MDGYTSPFLRWWKQREMDTRYKVNGSGDDTVIAMVKCTNPGDRYYVSLVTYLTQLPPSN